MRQHNGRVHHKSPPVVGCVRWHSCRWPIGQSGYGHQRDRFAAVKWFRRALGISKWIVHNVGVRYYTFEMIRRRFMRRCKIPQHASTRIMHAIDYSTRGNCLQTKCEGSCGCKRSLLLLLKFHLCACLGCAQKWKTPHFLCCLVVSG